MTAVEDDLGGFWDGFEEHAPQGHDAELQALLMDWGAFWDVDRDEAEWLAEPIIAAKRSHAIFAPGGTGKSLLSLWLAAALATGRPIFGRCNKPIDVLYLDYEMTEDDLHERLEAMGYGPDVDLSGLHYALLPSLPGLDEPEGGKAVVRLAQLCEAQLVVIDTFGRAVHGDENEADTVRAWYRWTGLGLKAEGRAFVRVDHAGKDAEKGQRGTSAKNDDVDVVWRLTRQDGDAFKLTATKRRMGWVPEKVDLVLDESDDLTYKMLGGGSTWPAGTSDTAKDLDILHVPVGDGWRKAQEVLRAADRGVRASTIRAAVKYRREQALMSTGIRLKGGSRNPGPTPPEDPGPNRSDPATVNGTNHLLNGGSVIPGPAGTHPSGVQQPVGGSLVGTHPAARATEEFDEDGLDPFH